MTSSSAIKGARTPGIRSSRPGKPTSSRLIPSGILTPGVLCVVTGGVVIHPQSLLGEIDGLIARGIEVGKNLVHQRSGACDLPLAHRRGPGNGLQSAPAARRSARRSAGIGPCYRDKVGRSYAIRLGDMYCDSFRDRIQHIVEAKNRSLAGLNGQAGAAQLDPQQVFAEYREYAERLKPFVVDTTALLLDAVESGKRVLFEGAQGALLDIDHGTFPFVTSSNSSGVGVSSGSGVPGRWITKVIGVLKAYSTRVGGGPFPTEQDNAIGEQIRVRGNEYGTVTRRPRRCGWFDAVAARYTARLSGVDCLAIMLLDVLSDLDEIKICNAYEIDGRQVDSVSQPCR